MKNILILFLLLISFPVFAQKGLFSFNVGLPYFNHMVIHPSPDISVRKAGFVGESFGLEYFYSDKKFAAFNAYYAGVAKSPAPILIDKEGPYTFQYTYYFSLTNNHQIKRFNLGYGMNYSMNIWGEGFRVFGDPVASTRNQINNPALGLTFKGHYKIRKSFHLGFIYRPTYFRLKKGISNKYEHFAGIEILWRIKINGKKK